jgi:G:T-mismatch repair DNA endonuclease (very short patch repair protein)
MERDIEQRDTLTKNGWMVISVWESDIMRKRTRDETLMKIKDFITG